MKLIDKDALVAEIKKRLLPVVTDKHYDEWQRGQDSERIAILGIINTLKLIDPHALWIQYPSIEDGINAFAEAYSFNIESHLFHQLTKEQQALWRKEIEQACISGSVVGVELATDPCYKKSLEAEEVNLEKEMEE